MLSRVNAESKYSIDVAHGKLLEKINGGKIILQNISVAITRLRQYIPAAAAQNPPDVNATTTSDHKMRARGGKKAASARAPGGGARECSEAGIALANCVPNIYLDRLDEIERDYKLSTVTILTTYYRADHNAQKCTKEYYRILAAGSYFSRVDAICVACDNMIRGVHEKFSTMRSIPADLIRLLEDILRVNDSVMAIGLTCAVETIPYDICKCGKPMTVYSDLSELRCDSCGICREVLGAVFSDDQFYPQEGQKTKYSDYAHSRHLRFWMDRIKGDEDPRSFLDMLDPIRACIRRDGRHPSELTCSYIRGLLKELNITKLNHHAAIIIKLCGGPPPPQTSHEDDRDIAIRFNKTMELYDVVNPDRCNKPYYPYFIYKIIESKFEGCPEKLRLLEYIHLQSDLTVIKNDNYYQQICDLADPEDGLVFHVTDRTKLQW